MDKKAIKSFAIEARKKLIDDVKYQAGLLGITDEGFTDPVKKADGMEVYDMGGYNPYTIYDEQIQQRNSLVKRVKEKGFDNVVEEVAYTWFNRIIAIRFMEVNDYLLTNIRVLSSETKDKIEPDIVTEAPNVDLDFSEEEKEKTYQLKDENKLDELFKLLFIKQCNKLNEILPELFEKTADYTELLISISFTNKDGVVRQLIDNISEDDFTDQVEIIGWLYQYYNTELKDDTFKQLKKRVKISKERIPAATQLFTPHWIVRYMVENSLGRLWLDGHPDSKVKENWKYYLDETDQEPEVQLELEKIREDAKNLKPEDIKIIDPAMGSGHILVYAFDVLMQIYTSIGYSERDAAESILKNNIYGLDIDDRAYQLTYFALMMKARSYNRRLFSYKIEPHVCSIQESNCISDELIKFFSNNNSTIIKDLELLKTIFEDAKEYGSIIKINERVNIKNLNYLLQNENFKGKQNNLLNIKYQDEVEYKIKPLIKQHKILSDNYDIIITNPPYMGSNKMNKILSEYLKFNYPNSKKDLFAVFIDKFQNKLKPNGYLSMITQHAFMFLSNFRDLRKKILSNDIINMIHLGPRAFEEIGGEVVQTSSFVIRNSDIESYNSKFIRLISLTSQKAKEKGFFSKENTYFATKDNFSKIPGSPLAYWATENIFKSFNATNLDFFADVKKGLSTGNNDIFLRYWFEVNYENIGFQVQTPHNHFKWIPINKGGSFRKWYGNNLFIIDWGNNGNLLKNFSRSVIRNEKYYFKKSLTWTMLSSKLGIRYSPGGFIFEGAGPSLFANDEILIELLGFLGSKVANYILNIINPTLNINIDDLKKLPIIFTKSKLMNEIKDLTIKNIEISKKDWDSYETSWDFKKHPLLFNEVSIISAFEKWKIISNKRFLELKTNEETLNEIFIRIYNLENELNCIVEETEISLSLPYLSNDIKSFISYAVGCMFGRYSLDEEGLIFAGGEWIKSKYSRFQPDDDNIVPILDEEYFEDDIVGRLVEFVKVSFGDEMLEENLDFIAEALKMKGSTSRDIIRNYFLTDFYKDHLKAYKKRPIYWLFDSGKNNGFKSLIYMHRYEPDLVARVRTDYLHKTQKALESAIANNERIIKTSQNTSEKSKAVKTRDKLVKQLEETRQYDLALAHIANKKIEIDLDDGVKVNYAKFQDVEVSAEGKKITKINLLTKI